MRIYNLLIISVLPILCSCKKDRLKDEQEVLIGEWKWVYSDHRYGWCDNLSLEEVLMPGSEGNDYSIRFLQKGVVQFYEASSSKPEKQYRIVFKDFVEWSDSHYVYVIRLDNNEELLLSGFVESDTLMVNQYPFKSVDQGCEDYDNYFQRN